MKTNSMTKAQMLNILIWSRLRPRTWWFADLWRNALFCLEIDCSGVRKPRRSTGTQNSAFLQRIDRSSCPSSDPRTSILSLFQLYRQKIRWKTEAIYAWGTVAFWTGPNSWYRRGVEVGGGGLTTIKTALRHEFRDFRTHGSILD